MRPGNIAIEFTKASQNGNGLLIPEDLPDLIYRGHAALTRSEQDSLKWVGVLFRKPTPGEFKMRVPRPNGLAKARPLRTIADLSRRLGNGVPSHDALAPVGVYRGIPVGARVSRAAHVEAVVVEPRSICPGLPSMQFHRLVSESHR